VLSVVIKHLRKLLGGVCNLVICLVITFGCANNCFACGCNTLTPACGCTISWLNIGAWNDSLDVILGFINSWLNTGS